MPLAIGTEQGLGNGKLDGGCGRSARWPSEKRFRDARGKEALRPEFADDVSKRSEEHTSELQSLMRISYAVFCLKKKTNRHEERGNRVDRRSSEEQPTPRQSAQHSRDAHDDGNK